MLPEESIIPTIRNIILPILTIYPAGTVLLGILMVSQMKSRENMNASAKLLESERRFIDMLTNFNYFSLILDRDCNIIFCNSKVLETSGFTFRDLSGKNAFDYLIPAESVKAVKNENFISSVATIGQDITSRKKAESELIMSKSKAEESDRLKTIFLSNMSHEIRTPMNAIMGFSALLGNEGLSETERKQIIGIIQDSGDKLLNIINDIIDISKIEAKQLSLSLSEFKLSEVIKNSLEPFRNSEFLKSKNGINLEISIEEKYIDTKTISDKYRIQQVLENLLGNAIKFTEKGYVETGFRITNDNDNRAIEAWVKDTGIGIPVELGEIIFERFRQADENNYHEGTGLGLSISKGIIEFLGGKIWFSSVLDEGTTFYFRIPLMINENKPLPEKSIIQGVPDLQGKTVILAEDDYNSFYYLRLLLKNLNANVPHAENGSVLMRLVAHKVPDLILLDINMPVMSGYKCLEEMKKTGIKTRIIAQTAYAMSSERERCLKAGCDGYISKPVTKSDLYRELLTVFSDNN